MNMSSKYTHIMLKLIGKNKKGGKKGGNETNI